MKFTLSSTILIVPLISHSVQAARNLFEDKIQQNAELVVKHQRKLELLLGATPLPSGRKLQQACTNAVNAASVNIVLGDVCQGANGACPASCQSALDDLNNICQGQMYTNEDGSTEPYDHALQVAAFRLLLDDPCASSINIGDAEATCLGTFATVSGDIVLGSTCNEAADGTCPMACIDMIQDLHRICRGEEIEDENGQLVPYDANVVVLGFQFLLEGACSTADLSPRAGGPEMGSRPGGSAGNGDQTQENSSEENGGSSAPRALGAVSAPMLLVGLSLIFSVSFS